MTIEEINELDIPQRIEELKKRTTDAPNKDDLLSDWDETKHDVMIEEKRPKRRVLVEEEERDVNGKIIKPAEYKKVEVNRIAIPLEQDIVNTQTAFTVGNEPKMTCRSEDKQEKNLFEIVKDTLKRNKIKYINKRVMRSWLSEQEVAEYWYAVEDKSWWKRILSKLGVIKTPPSHKLKVALWSPFRGDNLYPYFNQYGDLIAFSREYTAKENGKDVKRFTVIDNREVTTYQDGKEKDRFEHKFDKIPVIYIYRNKAYCKKIKTLRNRLEVLLSNFADCLDYNFYPKLVAVGDLEGIQERGTTNEIINLTGDGASVSYLTWQQSPEMAKTEFDNLTERVYSLTNTPRMSVEYLRESGNPVSGRAFKYVFMGAHLQVSNHAEDLEEYLERRVNFVVSAIGSLYPKIKSATETIDIDVEIVPFMIDNKSERINDAVSAVEGGVASRKEGIILAGITDRIEEELKAIEEDKKNSTEQRTAFSV